MKHSIEKLKACLVHARTMNKEYRLRVKQSSDKEVKVQYKSYISLVNEKIKDYKAAIAVLKKL